jgi:hypothetical protein
MSPVVSIQPKRSLFKTCPKETVSYLQPGAQKQKMIMKLISLGNFYSRLRRILQTFGLENKRKSN